MGNCNHEICQKEGQDKEEMVISKVRTNEINDKTSN